MVTEAFGAVIWLRCHKITEAMITTISKIYCSVIFIDQEKSVIYIKIEPVIIKLTVIIKSKLLLIQ